MPEQQQILDLQQASAPHDYLVGSNVEILLRAVNATFTDNGAATDWLPAVELVSDSGHTIALAADQGVKVTAGSDAKVSFFPWLTQAAAGTSSTTRIPWCLAEGDLPTNGTAPSYFTFDTKDTTMYALSGGSDAVLIEEPGLYDVFASASLETGAFAAATVLDLDCVFTAPLGTNYLQTVGSAGWASIGHAPGGTPIWNQIQRFLVSNKAGNVHTFHATLHSNPAGLDNADHYVFIQRIDDDYGGGL